MHRVSDCISVAGLGSATFSKTIHATLQRPPILSPLLFHGLPSTESFLETLFGSAHGSEGRRRAK